VRKLVGEARRAGMIRQEEAASLTESGMVTDWGAVAFETMISLAR
jgi:hypothetical protein